MGILVFEAIEMNKAALVAYEMLTSGILNFKSKRVKKNMVEISVDLKQQEEFTIMLGISKRLDFNLKMFDDEKI